MKQGVEKKISFPVQTCYVPGMYHEASISLQLLILQLHGWYTLEFMLCIHVCCWCMPRTGYLNFSLFLISIIAAIVYAFWKLEYIFSWFLNNQLQNLKSQIWPNRKYVNVTFKAVLSPGGKNIPYCYYNSPMQSSTSWMTSRKQSEVPLLEWKPAAIS